jgi:Flp pilus assembly protein TadG
MAGQSMVEFSMVAPVFFLVVLATIDFGGYFGCRLGVEEAARAGARAATTQVLSSFSGTPVTTAITAQRGLATLTTNADCYWQGTTLDPGQYPPFTFTGSGCVGIWYFDMMNESTGPPTLCTQWSVQHSAFGSYSSGTSPTWTAATPPGGCVVPQEDIVVVGVGYKYSPLTPMPAVVSSALTTYGETQLLEEGQS